MMGTTKRGTGKSSKTPARRTVRKKKPKVVLKTKSVVIMASSIIAVCILVLGLTFILSRLPSPSESKMSETAWKKAPADQPIEEVEIRDIAEPEKDAQIKSEPAKNSEEKSKEKTKPQAESNSQKENKSSSKAQDEEKVPVNSNREKKFEEKSVKAQEKIQEKSQDKTEAQKGLAQASQREVQKNTQVQQPQEQSHSAQKDAAQLQKQDRVASVKVTPSPQIQEIPKKLFDIPQAKAGARICFVIDDAGSSAANVKRYTSLPFPITIAVLPRLAQSAECAQAVRSSGKELILHQPMQAHDYPDGRTPNPGPGAILPDMDSFEVARTIKANLDSLGGGVKGFNNHEGSLMTENYVKMSAVVEVAMERGIYFLDSRTTSSSAVPQVALERDVSYLARFAPFLDNEVNRASMLEMLYKGLEVANKNGYAVMIGHVDKSVNVLPQLLSDIYPYLVQAGYRITVPSKL